jgi:hypothetical protein
MLKRLPNYQVTKWLGAAWAHYTLQTLINSLYYQSNFCGLILARIT